MQPRAPSKAALKSAPDPVVSPPAPPARGAPYDQPRAPRLRLAPLPDAQDVADTVQCARRCDIRRAFLVGCPRSGTTLLQSLLASHSAIHSPPETHFLNRLLRNEQHRQLPPACFSWPDRALRRWHALRRNGMVAIGWVGAKNVARAWHGVEDAALPPRSTQAWKLHSVHAQMRRFVQVLDRNCLHAGRRLWLEKTPDHLFYAARIQRHIADARFIHIVRNGEEVVASFHRLARRHPQWHHYLDEMRAAQRWNRAVKETLSWLGHPAHLIVRYESLLDDPRRALARILHFLGCESEDAIWHRYTESARSLIRADEPWKQGNLEAIHDCRKFAQTFDEARRARILAALDEPDWTALARRPGVVA